MITAATFMITESCRRYSLTDDRDQHVRYSGGIRKQDPGGQDPWRSWSEVLMGLYVRE
jgi:hypothetical protein